jgi:NADH-quinone oxidoreductase subunit K
MISVLFTFFSPITLFHYLLLSAILFGISLAGIVINRKNMITILMCIEMMLLAVNMNFMAFSYFHQNIAGQIFVFFILTVAAAEAAIGLALIILWYRRRGVVEIESLTSLKG